MKISKTEFKRVTNALAQQELTLHEQGQRLACAEANRDFWRGAHQHNQQITLAVYKDLSAIAQALVDAQVNDELVERFANIISRLDPETCPECSESVTEDLHDHEEQLSPKEIAEQHAFMGAVLVQISIKTNQLACYRQRIDPDLFEHIDTISTLAHSTSDERHFALLHPELQRVIIEAAGLDWEIMVPDEDDENDEETLADLQEMLEFQNPLLMGAMGDITKLLRKAQVEAPELCADIHAIGTTLAKAFMGQELDVPIVVPVIDMTSEEWNNLKNGLELMSASPKRPFNAELVVKSYGCFTNSEHQEEVVERTRADWDRAQDVMAKLKSGAILRTPEPVSDQAF